MVIIRPVNGADLDGFTELAGVASFGLTSLPKDRETLVERIAQSCRDFKHSPKKPRGELYIFVMEDLDTHRIVGTSCIVSKVGGFEPFYAYRVDTSVHTSEHLGIRKEIPTLHLVTEHSGPCEIGGLFLSPQYRRHGNGRLLSLFRFLFMAEYPERFEPLVIAEMRGVVAEDGHSVFWEALGRHFFEMDFPKADYLSATDKRFIADLMPRCPIYIPLLPEAAQEVVGKVHHNTEPALKMLLDEGFRFSGMVDIFEAGPIIITELNNIRIVRQNRKSVVAEITDQTVDSTTNVVARLTGSFRAGTGRVALHTDGRAVVEKSLADALELRAGDWIRFGPLRPSETTLQEI
jgi:arginine N-succinyltransferase